MFGPLATVLGIAAHYHDAAACLIADGRIVAAAQEERFTGIKFDSAFPLNAMRFCLDRAGMWLPDLDAIAFYEDPAEKLDRIVWSNASGLGGVRDVALAMRSKLDPLYPLRRFLTSSTRLLTFRHHASHAASAFFASGYETSAVLTVDGVGEWATTTLGSGRGRELHELRSIDFPHSLGLFYTTITAFLGFQPNSDEYKVMGLCAFGSPRYVAELRHVIQIGLAGDYRLDPLYFDYNHRMFSPILAELLCVPPRAANEPLDSRHADIAASAQVLLEEALIRLARQLHLLTSESALCMAGGVALNCVANAKIREDTPFQDIFVQPAAGDAGGAIGAAYLAAIECGDDVYPMVTALLGPEYSLAYIQTYLSQIGATYLRLSAEDLAQRVAALLADGAIVGWFQGRMEFGPRALGARSILADPRDARTRDVINLRVKGRESFRPFAPVCLQERADELFEVSHPEPFMTFVVRVRHPDSLAAVTHEDGTARLQTVVSSRPTRLVELLRAFDGLTGTPCLLNTSFNLAGDPIVRSPGEAFSCFREGRLDALVLEDCLVLRSAQTPSLVEPGARAYVDFDPLVPLVRDVYTFA